MQLEQLEYIIRVSESRSFSKAGQILHVSQSAVSQSITKLESELGVKIFERMHTGVKPTVEGMQLIKIATEVLKKVDDLKDQAAKYNQSLQNRLSIGIVSGLHLPFLPKLLSLLKQEFPQQEITLIEKSSLNIIEAIIQDEIDLGILVIYEETLKYKNIITFKEMYPVNLFVFVDKNSSLAHHEFLHPKDLKNQTFVMFNGEFMNWFFNIFNQQNGPFKLLFTSNNNENISEAVRNGLAIAIETESEALSNPFIKNGDILAIPLIEDVNGNSSLGIAKLKSRTFTVESLKTVNYFQSEIQDMFQERQSIFPFEKYLKTKD
ncbi:LysR family transcriptional regulator [Bacillus sp. FJAT-29814]|uniref:LysR family transcriptional regulator n=1 Tax=Bacillus sp. FJAT-29814 TaxID=1729688 RepID=UPI00083702B4|nr:LysR family transcriptional regulator [Bacillus sp. FJAT-29814]